MTYEKSSAELEREVKAQRDRVEARIGEIKDRLSPGQLLDEALAYTKDGGSHFASNLGHQVTANPLPVALIGIGLAWLMAPNGGNAAHASTKSYEADSYPYARIAAGGLRRISHSADESGQWWSEFETDDGDIYRARSTEQGHRAGHFTDKAGRIFSGFIDDAGNRIRQFQDEAGNTLSDAQGWANHGWHDLRDGIGHALHGVRSAASSAMSGTMSGTRHLGNGMQSQSDQLTRQLSGLFDQQPLIAGALAFAAGAALGAALPHTEGEDKLVGEPADKLRREAGKAAGKLYKAGKDQAADLYDKAADKAGRVYADAKDELSNIGSTSGAQSSFKH
ncbi:MAG TPA: DUF3618 domain-containing protein [Devosia sp.]|nr:DUF3618 domain-containing protein [Devosia sp.]